MPRLWEKIRGKHPGYIVWPGGKTFKKLSAANREAKRVSLIDVRGQGWVGDADTEEVRAEWREGRKVATNPKNKKKAASRKAKMASGRRKLADWVRSQIKRNPRMAAAVTKQIRSNPGLAISPGDFVKGAFRTGAGAVERMWVKVSRVASRYVHGVLDNQPLHPTKKLKKGAHVRLPFSRVVEVANPAARKRKR